MKIGIIGCGNMGTAFAKILHSHHSIVLYDHHFEKSEHLARLGFGKQATSLEQCLHEVHWVILAIKPQSFSKFSSQLYSVGEDKTVISLLTGISLDKLRKIFPTAQLVRLMPNLAVAYGKGALGICVEEHFSQLIREEINQAFTSLGKLFWMPEAQMDAFTSLAGSGPGFTFPLIEAMIEAGLAMGLNAKDSKEIVEQMLLGTLTVLEQTGKHPGELKWQVTSPAGTTIAGLRELENGAIKGKLMNVFIAAFQRAKELH